MLVLNRIAFELRCLRRALNPMKNGPIKPTAKAITLVLVGVWAILILDLTTAEPSTWLLMSFTAFIFTLVGRMWGLEADYWLSKLNPITISLGDDDE